MKKYYIYISTVFALLMMPIRIYATNLCDYGLLSDYRSLAKNINVTYSYKMEDDKPVFEVTISNLYEDMYVVDTLTNATYDKSDFTSDNEIIISGYQENSKISYQIYTRVAGCYGKMLTTRYVTFPNYNEFSTDEVCVGAEEFSLCQRWGAVAVDYDTFVAEVKAYKTKKANKNNKIIFNDEKTFWEKVFIFVGNYYVYLVSLVIIIILFISVLKKIFVKKNEFDFKV